MNKDKTYPAAKMASMLAITVDDYNDLKHGGLKAVRNEAGKITEYVLQVSSNNQARLLEKLDVDAENRIKFKPDYVDRIMKKK